MIISSNNQIKNAVALSSNADNGIMIRKYFIELEKLVNQFRETILDEYYSDKKIKHNNEQIYPEKEGIYITKERIVDTEKYKYKHKVSYTTNLKKRVRVLNTSVSDNEELVYFLEVRQAKFIEYILKYSLHNYVYRKRREFFICPLSTILKKLRHCVQFTNSLSDKDDVSMHRSNNPLVHINNISQNELHNNVLITFNDVKI
jgi:phage anti-repressor protein